MLSYVSVLHSVLQPNSDVLYGWAAVGLPGRRLRGVCAISVSPALTDGAAADTPVQAFVGTYGRFGGDMLSNVFSLL